MDFLFSLNNTNHRTPTPLHKLPLSLLGMLFALCSLNALGQTEEFYLKNGLKLIVKPDTRAPLVVFQVWYRIGSSYEPLGQTGISHMLEHMMFKGSSHLKPGESSRLIAEKGGQENAFTSRDYTGFFQIFAKEQLPLSFQLEAERMQHLVFLKEEFVKELEVVKEERRLRVEDSPQSVAYERFNAAAYTTLGYRQPTAGWMHDLNQMTLADVHTWYNAWYAPNNAFIVVAGDVEPKRVLALAKQYFEAVPPKPVHFAKKQQEITPLGLRTVDVHIPAEVPFLFMGFNTPCLHTSPEEPYALEVLAAILGGTNSSRLYQRLVVKDPIATGVWSDYNAFTRLEGLLILGGMPAAGQTLESLKSGILQEIKTLQTNGIQKEELERIKTQVIANQIYMQDSLLEQANQIGKLESIGLSWRLLDQFPAKIAAVTPKQIQAVAKKYLIPERLTVATLTPTIQGTKK